MRESELRMEFLDRLRVFAHERSGAAALRCERDYGYAELLDLIESWDVVLGAHRCVAVQLPNGANWASLDLALLFSSRVSVPIPEFFSVEQRDHALQSAGADLLVTAKPEPGSLAVPGFQGVFLHRLVPDPTVRLHPGTAKVTYTSGSTGAPKGVCLAANTLLNTACGLTQALAGQEVQEHMSVLPLSLLLENVAGLYANLWNGSSITLLPLERIGLGGSSSMDPLAFATAQALHQPQSIITVPQQLLALTALAEAGVPLSDRYRFIAVGGARVAPTLLARARGQGLPAYEGYGLSECGSVIALNTPENDRPDSAGELLPGVDASVINGELTVLEPKMLGYVNAPSLDVPLRTGDSASLSGSVLQLDGRLDNRIITSFGRNLSPEWTESELQAEIPIALACVFGDAQPYNVALILARDDATHAAVANSIDRCNSRLPDYARVSRFALLSREELLAADCLSPLGKLRRGQIEQAFGDELTDLFATEPSLPIPQTLSKEISQ